MMIAIGRSTPWVEWFWTISALVALIVGIWNLRAAALDRRWLRESGLNGARSIVVEANFRREALRVAQLVILTLVGIAMLSRPGPFGGSAPDDYFRLLGALASFAFLGMAVNSILDAREREAVGRLDDRDRAAKRGEQSP